MLAYYFDAALHNLDKRTAYMYHVLLYVRTCGSIFGLTSQGVPIDGDHLIAKRRRKVINRLKQLVLLCGINHLQ
ncbi:hypothetical protein WJX77_005236 [Trebouxia sp. C0004]